MLMKVVVALVALTGVAVAQQTAPSNVPVNNIPIAPSNVQVVPPAAPGGGSVGIPTAPGGGVIGKPDGSTGIKKPDGSTGEEKK
jgi:hypothetical protein